MHAPDDITRTADYSFGGKLAVVTGGGSGIGVEALVYFGVLDLLLAGHCELLIGAAQEGPDPSRGPCFLACIL